MERIDPRTLENDEIKKTTQYREYTIRIPLAKEKYTRMNNNYKKNTFLYEIFLLQEALQESIPSRRLGKLEFAFSASRQPTRYYFSKFDFFFLLRNMLQKL